jgi:hypothetical protein
VLDGLLDVSPFPRALVVVVRLGGDRKGGIKMDADHETMMACRDGWKYGREGGKNAYKAR